MPNLNETQVKILDTQPFLNQLKLLNVSPEFKNTCEFLINSNLQQGPMLENFMLGVGTMLLSLEGNSWDVTDDAIENIEGHNVSITEIEKGFNLKLVKVPTLIA